MKTSEMFGVCNIHLVPAACLVFGAHRVLKASIPQALAQRMCRVCRVLYSQAVTCLAVSAHGQCRCLCTVLSGQMSAVPMVYSIQGPLPSDYLQLHSPRRPSLSTTSPPAMKGQGSPGLPAPWPSSLARAGRVPPRICHQWSCGIKVEVLITQMLENGERRFPW